MWSSVYSQLVVSVWAQSISILEMVDKQMDMSALCLSALKIAEPSDHLACNRPKTHEFLNEAYPPSLAVRSSRSCCSGDSLCRTS